MAIHSSILTWRIPWTEEPGRLYSPWGCKELDMTERQTHTYEIPVINGTNEPMDICSEKQMKRLSKGLNQYANLPWSLLFDPP